MKLLPERPNLQFLKRQAKAIKSSHRNGDSSVCTTIGHFDTSLHGFGDERILDTRFSILDAQRVVARQHGFSSWSRLKHFVQRCHLGENPSDVKLREKVLARHQELNALQEEYRRKEAGYKDAYQQYRNLAKDSTQFLSTAFDCHGWPGPDVIGYDCVEALTYVSANAVYNADYQFRSTSLMGEALSEGGYYAYWYAQLHDRNLTLRKQPTVYGASFGSYVDADGEFKLLETEVIDPENLDLRRARVGLKAKAVDRERYAKEAKEKGWKHSTREQCLRELNKLSVEGGYQQQ